MNARLESAQHEVRQRVAANLSAELARKGYSDRQAATALGLNNVYVSRRANGTVELSVSDAALFASFLDIPITRLFAEEPSTVGGGTQLYGVGTGIRRPIGKRTSVTVGYQSQDARVTPIRRLGA